MPTLSIDPKTQSMQCPACQSGEATLTSPRDQKWLCENCGQEFQARQTHDGFIKISDQISYEPNWPWR
jgi:transposase-like protein